LLHFATRQKQRLMISGLWKKAEVPTIHPKIPHHRRRSSASISVTYLSMFPRCRLSLLEHGVFLNEWCAGWNFKKAKLVHLGEKIVRGTIFTSRRAWKNHISQNRVRPSSRSLHDSRSGLVRTKSRSNIQQ
jgi:hypothetical protein